MFCCFAQRSFADFKKSLEVILKIICYGNECHISIQDEILMLVVRFPLTQKNEQFKLFSKGKWYMQGWGIKWDTVFICHLAFFKNPIKPPSIVHSMTDMTVLSFWQVAIFVFEKNRLQSFSYTPQKYFWQ